MVTKKKSRKELQLLRDEALESYLNREDFHYDVTGDALCRQYTLMKKLTKRCFRLAMIPGLILLLLELVPRIWQLIFES